MFAVCCYDIRKERNAKVKKTVRKYLRPVQKSVCEGFISEAKLNRLCSEIKKIANPDEDSVVIYKFGGYNKADKLCFGKAPANENFIL